MLVKQINIHILIGIGFIILLVINLTISFYKSSKFSLNDDVICKVEKVFDGDTFLCLKNNNQKIKVRTTQIDAPEYSQTFGVIAKDYLSGLILNKEVTLKIQGKDKYHRTLAEVFFNGENINKKMVENGYAWAYREYLTDSLYIQLEEMAKSNKLGLWVNPNPIYPSDFRHQHK